MKIPYKYAVALTAALGLFMAVLDNTIVNVSLTAMQESFGSDLNSIQWVITAYFLAQAAVIPAAGYLSTRFGLKRMFILALAIFTVGSLLCGLAEAIGGDSNGEALLIACRVFQGIGGGALFPLGTAISFGAFPPEERAASSAFIAIPVLIAPTLGPTVGGLLVDSALGWPWIFYINVPVGIAAIALIARVFRPESETGGRGSVAGPRAPFDFPGLALSMVGIVVIVYAFTVVGDTRPGSVSAMAPSGEVYGWGYWLFWVLLAGGLVLLAAFAAYETRVARDPVLDLRLFRTYNFAVATLVTWAVRAVIFGSFFLLPLFLQQFRGLSAVEAGLAMMPQGIGAAIGITSGTRLYDRIGPRVVVVAGLIVLTISSALLIGIDTETTGWSLAPILLLRGIGFGWGGLPLQTVALGAITGRALPKASSLYNATAQVFSSIGIAVLSTLFLGDVTDRGAELAARAQAAGVAPPSDLALRAGAEAMSQVFTLLTIGTAVTTLLCLLLPRRSLKQEQEQEQAQEQEASGTAGAPARARAVAAE